MANSAATAIFCNETKARWDYNKNLDQITGLPNHRFLTEHGVTLGEDILKSGNPVSVLSLKVSNLPELYMSFGIEYGDQLQRGIVSILSKTLPSPKYIFKFSETIFIVILVDQKWSEAQPFKIKLEKILNNTPLFVKGEPMQICAELGMSCFPDNGKTISQLIGASLHETTSEFFSKTTTAL